MASTSLLLKHRHPTLRCLRGGYSNGVNPRSLSGDQLAAQVLRRVNDPVKRVAHLELLNNIIEAMAACEIVIRLGDDAERAEAATWTLPHFVEQGWKPPPSRLALSERVFNRAQVKAFCDLPAGRVRDFVQAEIRRGDPDDEARTRAAGPNLERLRRLMNDRSASLAQHVRRCARGSGVLAYALTLPDELQPGPETSASNAINTRRRHGAQLALNLLLKDKPEFTSFKDCYARCHEVRQAFDNITYRKAWDHVKAHEENTAKLLREAGQNVRRGHRCRPSDASP